MLWLLLAVGIEFYENDGWEHFQDYAETLRVDPWTSANEVFVHG